MQINVLNSVLCYTHDISAYCKKERRIATDLTACILSVEKSRIRLQAKQAVQSTEW